MKQHLYYISIAIGKGGYDGDGDITNPENVTEFRDYVLSCTGQGVHFVMADGVSARM